MAVGEVKATRFGSVAKLKRALASGGGEYFFRIAADTEVSVLFLSEPDDWWEFYAHYDEPNKRTIACNTGDCEYCDGGDKPRMSYLAPIVDLDNKKERIFAMPRTVVEQLVTRYERYKTLMDRPYIIARIGKSMNDTKYDVESGERPKRPYDMGRFQIPDIGAAVKALMPKPEDDYEDEMDDAIPARKAAKKATKRTGGVSKPQGLKRSRREDPEDDEDDDLPSTLRRPARSIKKPAPAKKAAKKTAGIRRPR